MSLSDFSFLFHFSMKILSANRIAPDGTQRFAAAHIGLFCLPVFHKKDTRLILVNALSVCSVQFVMCNFANLTYFSSILLN